MRFFLLRKEVKMSRPKNIYCPTCGKKVGKWDGRSTMSYITRCDFCKKRIVYHVSTGKTESKPLPPREYSSGLAFY